MPIKMGPLGQDVGFQIHITRRAIWAALRPARRKLQERVPSGYVSSLLLIGDNPGISPSQIAEALVLDMSNMVQIVRLLERADLITRQADPTDGRRVTLTLTPAGSQRYNEAAELSRAQMRKLTSQMSEAELRQLNLLLGKVRGALLSFQHEESGG